MNRNLAKYIFVFLIPFNWSLFGQDLCKVSKLPSFINETSGIEQTGVNKIWTFNDSGGKPEIYLCDTLGNHLRTIKITNGWNRDWEDITKDNDNNFYIGNIGNNANKSKDLTIFKIPNPEIIKGNYTEASIISFSFEDQYSFPPEKDSLNFDCEAMFWHNQYIYLFTKHRSFPTATNLYRIPSIEGEHIAKKIGTFYTGKKTGVPYDYGNHCVTAADISPDGTKISLINENKLWIFYDFIDDNFLDGKYIEIDLGKRTQKEAVCFATNECLYITDEHWSREDIGGNLYKIEIGSFFEK